MSVLFGHTKPRKERMKRRFFCKLCGEYVGIKKAHLINFHKAVRGRMKNKSSNDWVDKIFVAGRQT